MGESGRRRAVLNSWLARREERREDEVVWKASLVTLPSDPPSTTRQLGQHAGPARAFPRLFARHHEALSFRRAHDPKR